MSQKTFRLPDLGEGLTESEIVTWRVAEGDAVTVNQVLADVETAKAVVEVSSPFAGVVAALHGAEGETLEVGAPLVTFTLEPHRARVVGAKFCAGLLLGLGLIVVAFAIGALGNVIAGGTWDVETGVLVNGFIVANLIGILLGFAIGMLLMNSPAAIVAYFIYTLVLPIAVGILGAFQEWFADLAPWIEFNTAQASLFEGDAVPTGEELGQLLVSGFIWLVVPFAVGLWRLLRAEPK